MSKNQLTRLQMIQLANRIRDDYTASALHDGEFAAKVTETIGFPVTESNVAGLRRDLGIPSLREVRNRQIEVTFAERLARIERLLARLEPNWKDQV